MSRFAQSKIKNLYTCFVYTSIHRQNGMVENSRNFLSPYPNVSSNTERLRFRLVIYFVKLIAISFLLCQRILEFSAKSFYNVNKVKTEFSLLPEFLRERLKEHIQYKQAYFFSRFASLQYDGMFGFCIAIC